MIHADARGRPQEGGPGLASGEQGRPRQGRGRAPEEEAHWEEALAYIRFYFGTEDHPYDRSDAEEALTAIQLILHVGVEGNIPFADDFHFWRKYLA